MRLRRSTAELIEAEYSDAVVSGDYERAEGWFAVARFAASRDSDRRTGPLDSHEVPSESSKSRTD